MQIYIDGGCVWILFSWWLDFIFLVYKDNINEISHMNKNNYSSPCFYKTKLILILYTVYLFIVLSLWSCSNKIILSLTTIFRLFVVSFKMLCIRLVSDEGSGGGREQLKLDMNQLPSSSEDNEELSHGGSAPPRKKLRLTKEQFRLLEDCFRQNHSLNPVSIIPLQIVLTVF